MFSKTASKVVEANLHNSTKQLEKYLIATCDITIHLLDEYFQHQQILERSILAKKYSYCETGHKILKNYPPGAR